LTETGYVNVDKNDFSSILSYEGESILGVGKAETEELAFEALDQALNNPLVSIANIDTAKGIIFQLFCKSEPKLSTYNGLIDHIREKITNKSVLIVPGVTLDPSLSSEIEILIVASGISSLSVDPNSIDASKPTDNDFLDDDLVYDDLVCNELFSNDGKEQSYTDIPAITRKLRADKLTGEKNV
jgi:cell division protein FtsZ